MNHGVKPWCLIKVIQMVEESAQRMPHRNYGAPPLSSHDFQKPAAHSQLRYLGIKEAMKGDKQTMSLMGKNRPSLLKPEPKNKTGWLHF